MQNFSEIINRWQKNEQTKKHFGNVEITLSLKVHEKCMEAHFCHESKKKQAQQEFII